MQHVRNFQDLRRYGIDCLTGEACGLGYRLLCDVTAKGKAILEKVLDCELTLAGNWNYGSDEDPHVGSIMLSYEMLNPIAAFAMLESGCCEVWIRKSDVIGFEDKEKDYYEEYAYTEGCNARKLSYRGTCGDRNLHVMSGRVR
jgi:hypothetical protein